MDGKKQRGRPQMTNAKRIKLSFRVTEEEKKMIYEKAKEKGLTVTELILRSIKEY